MVRMRQLIEQEKQFLLDEDVGVVVADLPGSKTLWDSLFLGPGSAVLGVATGLPGGIGVTEAVLGGSMRLRMASSSSKAESSMVVDSVLSMRSAPLGGSKDPSLPVKCWISPRAALA